MTRRGAPLGPSGGPLRSANNRFPSPRRGPAAPHTPCHAARLPPAAAPPPALASGRAPRSRGRPRLAAPLADTQPPGPISRPRQPLT
jgi:hypothetical protein